MTARVAYALHEEEEEMKKLSRESEKATNLLKRGATLFNIDSKLLKQLKWQPSIPVGPNLSTEKRAQEREIYSPPKKDGSQTERIKRR